MSSPCCAGSASAAARRRPPTATPSAVTSPRPRPTRPSIIEGYLPAELSDAELDALVATAIAETGAECPRDMGKAIKHVMSAAGGRADGKRVSGKVKEALVS